jgi:hypothetical protein
MLALYRIDLTDLRRDGIRRFVMFETSAGSIAELHQRLQDDKVLFGHALDTRPGEEAGSFEVTGRRECIIGREAVYEISVPRRRYYEVEE